MKSFAAVVLFLLMVGTCRLAQAQNSGSCPGCIAVIGVSNVTGQSSSQTPVTLVTPTANGSYMIRWYADESSGCASATGGVTFTFTWTDASASRNFTTPQLIPDSGNTPGKFLSGSLPLYAKSGVAISYSSNYMVSCIGTFAYDVHVSVEQTQ